MAAHRVDACGLERQLLGRHAGMELDAVQSCCAVTQVTARLDARQVGAVNLEAASLRRGGFQRNQRDSAVAGADIDHPCAVGQGSEKLRPRVEQLEVVAALGRGGTRGQRAGPVIGFPVFEAQSDALRAERQVITTRAGAAGGCRAGSCALLP